MAKEKETKAKKAPKAVKPAKKEAAKKPAKEKKEKIDLELDGEEAVESLDSIKKRLLKKAKSEGGEIEQSEIQEAISFLDMSDEELEEFMSSLESNE